MTMIIITKLSVLFGKAGMGNQVLENVHLKNLRVMWKKTCWCSFRRRYESLDLHSRNPCNKCPGIFSKAKYKMVSIDLNQMIGVHVYLAMGAQVSWSAPPSEIFQDLNKSR